MRMSDGLILEYYEGIMFSLETDHIASVFIISWSMLYFFNGDKSTINAILTQKIEEAQQRLDFYMMREAADGGITLRT